MPGHTHEDIDQFFSNLATYFRLCGLPAFTAFEEAVRRAYCRTQDKRPVCHFLSYLYDFKTYYHDHLNKITGYTSARAFKFAKDANDGMVKLWYKESPLDSTWKGCVINGRVQGILVLSSFPTGLPTFVSPQPIPSTDIDQILDTIRNSSVLTTHFLAQEVNSYVRLRDQPLAHLSPTPTTSPFDDSTFTRLHTQDDLILPAYLRSEANINVDLLQQIEQQNLPPALIPTFHIAYTNPSTFAGFCIGCILSSTSDTVTFTPLSSPRNGVYVLPTPPPPPETISRDRLITNNFNLTAGNQLRDVTQRCIRSYFLTHGHPSSSSGTATSIVAPSTSSHASSTSTPSHGSTP